jgi:hypothetical protein
MKIRRTLQLHHTNRSLLCKLYQLVARYQRDMSSDDHRTLLHDRIHQRVDDTPILQVEFHLLDTWENLRRTFLPHHKRSRLDDTQFPGACKRLLGILCWFPNTALRNHMRSQIHDKLFPEVRIDLMDTRETDHCIALERRRGHLWVDTQRCCQHRHLLDSVRHLERTLPRYRSRSMLRDTPDRRAGDRYRHHCCYRYLAPSNLLQEYQWNTLCRLDGESITVAKE